MLIRIVGILIVLILSISVLSAADPCEWDNKNGVTCLKIIKPIPNTSKLSSLGLKSYTITSREIKEYGAVDVNEIMEMN